VNGIGTAYKCLGTICALETSLMPIRSTKGLLFGLIHCLFAFGAFGAHGLKSQITDEKRISAWATGAQYHLLHSVAILACTKQHKLAVYLFIAGIVLFSGSLYAYGGTGNKFFAKIAPIGGTSFILGWLALAFL